MKRYLSLLFLLVALRCWGAAGDILGAEIQTNGWVLKVWVSEIDTNGAFSFGFGTNGSGTSTVVLTGTCAGFDDVGASNRMNLTVYGTKQLRKPYPYNTNNDVVASGSDSVIQIALSDYITPDWAGTISFAANFYSNSASATFTPTNSSQTAWPSPVANWSWPGRQLISGSTMTLRTVAFGHHPQQGRPVRVVKFIAQDTSGNATTNYVTIPTIDSTAGDAVPIVEYIASMNISSFTQSNLVRCDFIAYPWAGTNFLSTLDGVNANPPEYAPITNVCNRLLTYGEGVVAVVDSASGSDSTGAVVTNFNYLSPPAAFLSIAGAANAINNTNKVWFSRTNVGGATIYCRASTNNYNWTGGTVSAGNAAPCWVTVATYPGDARAWITNFNGTKDITDCVALSNMTISVSPAAGCFDNINDLWFDNCTLDCPANIMIYRIPRFYVTRCAVDRQVGQIFHPLSTTTLCPVLIRGNTFKTNTDPIYCYTMLGNKRAITNSFVGGMVLMEGYAGNPSSQPIFAFNQWDGLFGTARGVQIGLSSNIVRCAVVQNTFEWWSSSGQACLWIAADSSINEVDNVLVWNNTITGDRVNEAYNSIGTNSHSRVWWRKLNNAFDDDNIKSDTFATQDSARTGNWSQLFGVASRGNMLGNLAAIGAADFTHTQDGGFAGLATLETSTSLAANWPDYTDRKAYNGAASEAGFGTYRLNSTSPMLLPALALETVWALPYDIEGNARGMLDPPGAYASASPRKGAGFFAQ